VADKLAVIENLMEKDDTLIIAAAWLHLPEGQGYEVGRLPAGQREDRLAPT
jgi:3-phosphoglycerate kinase